MNFTDFLLSFNNRPVYLEVDYENQKFYVRFDSGSFYYKVPGGTEQPTKQQSEIVMQAILAHDEITQAKYNG